MKKSLPSFLLFLIGFLLTDFAYGQQGKAEYVLKGRVIDASSGNPLPYTTVSLHHPADSSLVTGNTTDDTGKFEISAPAGNYQVKVQFISYETKTISNVSLGSNRPVVDLGDIALAEDSKTLSEVVVAGQKQQMELNLDKRVFNVSNDLSNIGRNASEILDNVPSISVDVEGNVSLRGSSNVRILVNGKPSGLVGLSSPDALRMLQGDLIERIEVITNPSARYEAEGMAGIINIILKKDNRTGLNGSLTINLGHPVDYGASLNVNLRRKWFNLFSSYGFNYRESPGGGKEYQEVYKGVDTTLYTEQIEDRIRTGISHNFRIGSDFTLSENSTLTASALYRISDEENFTDIRYTDRYSYNNSIDRTLRKDKEVEDEGNMEYELNFTRTFDKEDQKFTAAAQFRKGGETESSNIEEIDLDESRNDLFQRSINDENSQNILLQADYVHPFNEDGKFEAGYKSTFRKIETDYAVEEQNEAGVWEKQSKYTNNFNYDESIHALYAIFGNKVNKFSYQIGLRAELSQIKTELTETENVETDAKSDKSYINLFPSAHITYELKNENSFQASYSRRLNRPRYWNLNPFHSLSDNRNIRSGNPNLDPEYTNSFEVGYLKNWEKGSLYSGAYYRHSTEVIEWLREMQNDGITLTRPENFGIMDAYGIEANISKDMASWWQLNVNGNFYRAITEGTFLGESLKSDTYTFSGRLNSKMTFWKAVNYQINLRYRSPTESPQGKRKAFTSVDMALGKDILKGKGTLTFSVSDLLDSRKWRNETFGENFYSESEFQWRSRQFRLSFSYRLNQKKSQQRGDGGFEGEGGGEEGEF